MISCSSTMFLAQRSSRALSTVLCSRAVTTLQCSDAAACLAAGSFSSADQLLLWDIQQEQHQQPQDHRTTLQQQSSSSTTSLWGASRPAATQAVQKQQAGAQQHNWLFGGLQQSLQHSIWPQLQSQAQQPQQEPQLQVQSSQQQLVQKAYVQQIQHSGAAVLQPPVGQLLEWPAMQLPSGGDGTDPEPLLCVKRTFQPHVRRYKRKHGFLKRWVAWATLQHLSWDPPIRYASVVQPLPLLPEVHA